MTDESAEVPQKPEKPQPPSGRLARILGRVAFVAAITCLVLVLLLQFSAPSTDYQIANMLSYLLFFLCYLNVIGWMALAGPGSRAYRRYSVLVLVLLPVLFFAVFRVDGFSGEMVPRFRFRWAPAKDATLSSLDKQSSADAVALTSSEFDYSGFLGSDRSNRLPDAKINLDWKKSPPKLLWRREIGAGWGSFAIVNGYAVTLEQRGPQEWITCYNVKTGEPQWATPNDARHETKLGGIGPRSTPTVADGRVYAIGATGMVRCLNGADGEVIWEIDLLKEIGVTVEEAEKAVAWGRAGSPLVVDDLVIVPYGGPADGTKHSLAAYHKETGELVWHGGDRQIAYSSPNVVTLAGKRQVVCVNEDNVSGHDLADGTTLWQFDWPGASNANASASQAVAVDADLVLVSKGYGGGAALYQIEATDDGFKAVEQWSNTTMLKTKFTNVSVFGDHVYALSDGMLECIQWRDEKRKWRPRAARYGQGQVLGLAECLLGQAEDGEVALVAADPAKYRELGNFSALTGQTWNNLAYSEPYLLVRNGEEAACFELSLD